MNKEAIGFWNRAIICENCENNLRKAGVDDAIANRSCDLSLPVESKDKLATVWSEIRTRYEQAM